VLEPHGQHGIDAESELQRSLHHQQVRTRSHARHDAQLGVRKTFLELLQDLHERPACLLQRVRVQVPMP